MFYGVALSRRQMQKPRRKRDRVKYLPVASIIAVANRFLAVAAAQTMPRIDYHIIIRWCRHTQNPPMLPFPRVRGD